MERQMKSESALVRPAALEELADVAEIELSCFSKPWSQNALRLLLEGENICLVALDGESVCAYGGMLVVLDEGQITNVATSAQYRRRGYARAIVEGLLAYARERGLCVVSLEVRESNIAAIALYESLGFKRAGVRKNFYSLPTENALVMLWEANKEE